MHATCSPTKYFINYDCPGSQQGGSGSKGICCQSDTLSSKSRIQSGRREPTQVILSHSLIYTLWHICVHKHKSKPGYNKQCLWVLGLYILICLRFHSFSRLKICTYMQRQSVPSISLHLYPFCMSKFVHNVSVCHRYVEISALQVWGSKLDRLFGKCLYLLSHLNGLSILLLRQGSNWTWNFPI